MSGAACGAVVASVAWSVCRTFPRFTYTCGAVLAVSDVASQAEAEALTLLKADNKTGYFGVYHKPGCSKPYQVPGPSPTRRG